MSVLKIYNVKVQQTTSWRDWLTVGWNDLCVPGMGMILWGVSPLYIIWEVVIFDNFKKY